MDTKSITRIVVRPYASSLPLGCFAFGVGNTLMSVFSPVKDMEASDYKRVTDVTYLGFVHGTLSALRRMIPRNRGTIIQIGSALAYGSIPKSPSVPHASGPSSPSSETSANSGAESTY
jgi:NAD(P)-dependent dehydrogenase (short-subunit alcohol dehydrogenase family)